MPAMPCNSAESLLFWACRISKWFAGLGPSICKGSTAWGDNGIALLPSSHLRAKPQKWPLVHFSQGRALTQFHNLSNRQDVPISPEKSVDEHQTFHSPAGAIFLSIKWQCNMSYANLLEMLLEIKNFLAWESTTKWDICANTWQVENTVWYPSKNIRFSDYIFPLKKGNTLPKHFPLKERQHVAKTFPSQTKAAYCQNISPLNKGCMLLKHFPLKQRLHIPFLKHFPLKQRPHVPVF